jgi:hypothetical protein
MKILKKCLANLWHNMVQGMRELSTKMVAAFWPFTKFKKNEPLYGTLPRPMQLPHRNRRRQKLIGY